MKEKEKQKRDWLPGVLMAAAISFLFLRILPIMRIRWEHIPAPDMRSLTFCLENGTNVIPLLKNTWKIFMTNLH